MSGSEFERENIVTDALSADPASKPFEPAREHTWRPPAEGLYDLSLEKDSCGVGFIANIKGKKSHQIVSDAISILCNLEHRGAVGADPRAGDGAGILVQIPHAFFARKAKDLGFTLTQPCPCRKPHEMGHSTAPPARLTSEERDRLEAVL